MWWYNVYNLIPVTNSGNIEISMYVSWVSKWWKLSTCSVKVPRLLYAENYLCGRSSTDTNLAGRNEGVIRQTGVCTKWVFQIIILGVTPAHKMCTMKIKRERETTCSYDFYFDGSKEFIGVICMQNYREQISMNFWSTIIHKMKVRTS